MSECQEIACCPDNPFAYSISGGGGTTFYNTRQCATAYCPGGTTGAPVERCKDAGLYSASTQDAANTLAYNAAFAAATAALSCSGGGGCANLIPQMTGFSTPSGTVIVPSNMSAPVGSEGWRAFTVAGEYKPNQFVGGLDNGKYVGAVGYLFAAAKKASTFSVQFGALDLGQLYSFAVIAYSDLPAGWPGTWTDCSVFPGGGTVLANDSGSVFGPVITTPSYDSVTGFKLFVFECFIGNSPPWQAISLKNVQICGSS